MISKQRLEELIEQGATIYENKEGHILEISFDNENIRLGYKVSGIYLTFGIQEPTIIAELENLFETEEDARWELEMTATRTETLKMPKWEEAQDEKFHFSYLIDVKGLHLFISIYNFTKRFEIYCNHGVHTCDYKFERTFDLRDKEQYETACKLCLRLFKGEEV